MPSRLGRPTPRRVIAYSTVPPTARAGWRRALGATTSALLHLALLLIIVRVTTSARQQAQTGAREQVQSIPLTFLPPTPRPTPRQPAPETAAPPVTPPVAPLTPGQDQAPGTIARVTPDPEPNPNAPPRTAFEEATRPVPTDDEAGGSPRSERTGVPPASLDPTAAPTPQPPNDASTTAAAQVSEARRLFGPGPSRLGPVSGTRENRPWETMLQLPSRGCTLPAESGDSTLPPGMAMVAGKILNENNGRPLAGARLQILGTAFGAFSNEVGDYRLIFDRSLVDLCRTQSVRVTAPGYRSRDVILYVGEPLSSDVPLSRY